MQTNISRLLLVHGHPIAIVCYAICLILIFDLKNLSFLRIIKISNRGDISSHKICHMLYDHEGSSINVNIKNLFTCPNYRAKIKKAQSKPGLSFTFDFCTCSIQEGTPIQTRYIKQIMLQILCRGFMHTHVGMK